MFRFGPFRVLGLGFRELCWNKGFALTYRSYKGSWYHVEHVLLFRGIEISGLQQFFKSILGTLFQGSVRNYYSSILGFT